MILNATGTRRMRDKSQPVGRVPYLSFQLFYPT